ncbi:hypothetical protein T190820D02B_11051 [Tenacibaculum sp. 190524A05c]
MPFFIKIAQKPPDCLILNKIICSFQHQIRLLAIDIPKENPFINIFLNNSFHMLKFSIFRIAKN